MNILAIGEERHKEKEIMAVIVPLIGKRHAVSYAPNEITATWHLKRGCFDVIVFITCERLEETDLVAERLRHVAREGSAKQEPYVFVIWDAVCGIERGGDYGLKAIDILIEYFSLWQFKQAIDCPKR